MGRLPQVLELRDPSPGPSAGLGRRLRPPRPLCPPQRWDSHVTVRGQSQHSAGASSARQEKCGAAVGIFF